MSGTMMPSPGMQPGGPPPMGAPPPGPPGMPPGAQMPQMPQPQPNPAFAAWVQQAQQVQQITAANAQKQAQFEAAVALIKSDGLKGFRLDIEADSTIAPDEQAEKQARVEFLAQMIPMLEQVVPIAQGNPPLAALAKEMTLFAVRGFRVSRPLEEAFEQAFDAIAQMPPNPKFNGQDHKGPAPGPDPQIAIAKTQADVHNTDTKAATDRANMALKQQQLMVESQIEREKMQASVMHTQADLALKAQDMSHRASMDQMKTALMGSKMARGLV